MGRGTGSVGPFFRAVLPWLVAGCYQSGEPPTVYTRVEVQATSRLKVDLLVMVDNSGSMAQEQAVLAAQFAELLPALLEPLDGDGDTRPDAPPVEDLHVGVISSDMGTMGHVISTCTNPDVGDDGCLRHMPSTTVGGCDDGYPPFLARDPANAETYSSADLANDFACIATLGTRGCGFEQQLEAMRRAVLDNQAPGRCNEGFLRDDSVVVLLFVTDEDDCSVDPAHPEMFATDSVDLGHFGVRCFSHPELQRTPEWFRDEFLRLRPDDPGSVVMVQIVGVPPEAAVCETATAAGIRDCLALPEMQPYVDPAAPSRLAYSCSSDLGFAFPPERLVRLARLWVEAGGGARLGSICREDWSATFAGLRQDIASRLRPECLDTTLELPALTPTPEVEPSCAVDCRLVALLPGDVPCPVDPGCPASACPPASLDDLLWDALTPCGDSATGGATCEPLLRDLGRATDEPGTPRACLVRQDPGSWDSATARCVGADPLRGWRYVPPEWDERPGGPCSQLLLPDGFLDALPPGSGLRLYCRT
ncbi:MAG: hypothetical protein JXB32_02080 [Deltaproteobacteria bacterium]|nr:hypothetical protein [Deltaproteobacteria bacterium]